MGLLDATTVAIELRQDHGFSLLVLMLTVFVHFWYMAVRVAKARKKFGVKYPALYADTSIKNANDFNCIQRGHQNCLEQIPHFIMVFSAASVKYPLAAAVAGLIYNVGKVAYMEGYSTGHPEGRMRGAFSYFGLFGLYGMVFMFANNLLKLSR